MADPSWPSTVPSEPEIGNYREAVISGNASFQPDTGPPTSWRMSTLDSIAVQASFILHSDTERDSFKAFFRTTLRDGQKKFIWDNPAYDVPGVYLFEPENPPQLTPVGPGRWRLGVSVIKLGDAPPQQPTFDSDTVTFDSTLFTWDNF
jgi:hypothetical protein